jgi:membrane protein DedA with SNARE-associated domain
MFERLFEVLASWISELGYLGVFLLMVAESMILPVPSEGVMPFAGFLAAQGRFTMAGVALASSAGSLVGSWLSYGLGFYGGRPLLRRWGKYLLLHEEHLVWSERFFERYGQGAILLGRLVPVVRHLISIPAGMASMPPLKFTTYTLLGATAWNMFLAWVGYELGERWHLIHEYEGYFDAAVLSLVFGLGAYWWWSRRHKASPEKPMTNSNETDPMKETGSEPT